MKRDVFKYFEKTDQKRGKLVNLIRDKQLVGGIELVAVKLISHILILPSFSNMVKLWKKNPPCQEKHTRTHTHT